MPEDPAEEELQLSPEQERPIEIEAFDTDRSTRLSWDERTRKMMRQILTQKVDLPISRLRSMIDEKEIELKPDFQRRLRWSRAQQSRLIESIVMNVPIPPVFLGEDQPGRYVVLDGRQRLTALYEFLGNQYRLSGLNVWSELNGKNFKQLGTINSPPVASAITRRFVPAIIILHESVPDVKYEVFDRLNTGGVIAEPMEVRNAIYRGKFTSLLHAVTELEAFRRLWGIPTEEKQRARNTMYRKMADLEMALRFFAFQEYEKFSGSIKSFLNKYMEERNLNYEKDPNIEDADRELFTNTMERTLRLLGEEAFRRLMPNGKRSPVPSAPLADAVAYAISRLPPEKASAEQAAYIRAAIDDLCLNDTEFVDAITFGTNAKTAVEDRISKLTRRVLGAAADAPIS